MKFKKFFILLIALCSVSNFSVFASKSSSETEDSSVQIEQAADEAKTEESFSLTEKTKTESEKEKGKNKTWNTVKTFLKMILSLVLVVVIIFLIMNFFKKSGKMGGANDDTYLRKVAHLNLAPGKSVQVVTLLDNCYILGVTDNNINLIGEVDDKELISAMNVSADTASKSNKPKTFGEVLEMFMPSKSSRETSATQTNIYSNTSNDVADFINKQRSKISKKGDTKKK